MRQRPTSEVKFEAVDYLLGPDPALQGATTAEPLDEQEQEAIIRAFEAYSSQQHRIWRYTFGGGALLAGLFFLYATWRQHVEPFGVRYTGELRSATSASAVTAVLFVQGVSLLLGSAGLLTSKLPPPGHRAAGCLPFAERQRSALWGGVLCSAVGAVYWTMAFVRMAQMHGRQHVDALWELTWLPAGPLAGCLLCCYVASTLADSEREIQRLRGCRYQYKKL